MNPDMKILRLDSSCPEDRLQCIERWERENFSAPWTGDMLRRALSREDHIFLLLLRDGSPAGYIGAQLVIDEAEIFNVAVDSAFRRQHIGERLVRALCDAAKAAGAVRVMLEVRAGNAPAIALYEKLGFAAVGRRKNYYEKPREDAILMDCDI